MKKNFRNVVTAVLFALLITLSFSSVSFAEDTGGRPVLQYKFDGDFTDASGNGYDGTQVGEVTFADDGVFGKCAEFSNGFLNVATGSSFNMGKKFTISVWVKLNPEAATVNGAILSKLDENNVYSACMPYIQGTALVAMPLMLERGEASVRTSSLGTALVEKWTHVVFTNDGTTLYAYIDGKLNTMKQMYSGDKYAIKDSTGKLLIGVDGTISSGKKFFLGKMDDLRVYNYALGGNEIKALYNAAGGGTNKIELTINDPYMMVNDRKTEIDPGKGTRPVIINGRTLVPIRAIIEAMGGTVGWVASEKRVDISLNSKQLKLWVNRNTANLNSTQLKLDVPPKILKERTIVPLRFVSENLGCKAEWDALTQKITLRY